MHFLLRSIYSLLLPASCQVCGAALLPRALPGLHLCSTVPHQVCPACLEAWMVGQGEPGWRLDGVPGRSLGWYERPVTGWIHSIKSGRAPGLLKDLAACWIRPPLDAAAPPLLVPVPADPLRARSRGMDPVARLARHWAAAWELECRPLLLRRPGRKQQGLGAAERRGNLAAQYRLGRLPTGTSGPIWLVDDVVTTGATLSICRELLAGAGIEVGGFLTLACTPRPEMRLADLEHLLDSGAAFAEPLPDPVSSAAEAESGERKV